MENDILDNITFADDLTDTGGGTATTELGGDAEPKVLTPEEKIAALEGQVARYKSLDFLADALEKDPSKIHDLRASVDGRIKEPSLTEHPTAVEQPKGPKTVLEAIQMLPQEKRDELNTLASEKPAEYQAALADLSAQIHLRQFATASQPIVDATVANAIAQFKSGKSVEAIFKHALPYFEREMADFDRTTFYQLPEAQRTRQMELRWSSAKASAYDTAAAKRAQPGARNLGGGGGAGGGGSMKTVVEPASDAIAELAARSGLKPGQLEAIRKSIEA